METHYVCSGTPGEVSEIEKNCENEACPMYGEKLVPCNCEDGKHAGVLGTTEGAAAL